MTSRRALAAIGAAAVMVAVLPPALGAAGPPAPSCPWVGSTAPVADRVAMVLGRMSLAEKVSMIHGVTSPGQSVGLQPGAPPYVGVVPGLPRLCLPELKLEDGPAGVGDGMTGVTQLPAPVAAASTWDRALMQQYGEVIGAEQWAKGTNVVLAPTVNIVRDPRWGRAFESLGEDPYLAGQMGVADIDGIQSQGPMAQVKHLAAYNEETLRDTPLNDVIATPRTLQEVYLPAFEAAVQQAHVASVMCAYNEVNHVPDCQSPYLMSQVLKGQFGFVGFVTSDWFAMTSSADAANAGLDMEMPDPCFFGSQLPGEVQTGAVAVSRLDDMVGRILGEMFRFGLFDHAPTGSPTRVATTAAHVSLARRAAEDGTVLLKNASGMLPLDAHRDPSVAVIGADGGTSPQTGGGGSASVVPSHLVTPLQAISRRVTHVTYDDGTNLAQAVATAHSAQVAIVFVSLFDEEDRDQTTIGLPAGENALVSAVAAANPNTVVVLNTGSAVLMPWLDQVRAVLEAWYPGQEDGNALAALLFGDVNPSGKLPVTFPASQLAMPTSDPRRWPGVAGETEYAEGLAVGHRWYDANNVTPAFPFGFGLSYTTFRFSSLQVHPSGSGQVTVTANVTNSGPRTGADVVQLYLTDPAAAGEPPRALRGFDKVVLRPGQTAAVRFTLDARALSGWDPALGRWHAWPGTYRIEVGDSSRSLPLAAPFTLARSVVSGLATPAPPRVAPESPASVAADAAVCWQPDVATLANGALSITGESVPANPTQLPLG